MEPREYRHLHAEWYELASGTGRVLVSGGLGPFTVDDEILRLFERVRAHLIPGGLFLLEFELLTPSRDKGEEPGWTGDWISGPDDVVIAWRNRNHFDPSTHVWRRLFVVEKFVSGRLVGSEANERTGRFFTVEEVVKLARGAGFTDIIATDWLTEEPPAADSAVVTVRCRMP